MTKIYLLLLLLTGLFSSSLFSQKINIKKLDGLFDALSINNKAMGSIAISKNGKVVYTRSIGLNNIYNKGKTAASEKTLYRIGSATKMFTATMIFQLIEEHKISLSTKLDKFFPQIPNSRSISIETLLNHKSGLYDYINDQKDLTWITRPQSTKIIIEKITKGKPNSLPNEKFKYSNSGYFLLANILLKVTQQGYNENLQKRICSKIQLRNTYSPLTNELKNNEAGSFSFANGEWTKMTDIYFPNVVGIGDILSTPSDLIKFDEALLGGQLISEASLKSMKTFTDYGFGMGIMKVPFYKKVGFGHAGDTYGTHSVVANFTSDSLTFAACINGEVFPHNDISIGILSICFNEKYEIPTFKVFGVSAETLNKYIGVYSSKVVPLKITITRKDNLLFAQATGQPSFPLEATEQDKFRYVQAGVNMEFNTDKNELIMIQGGGSYFFSKDK
ncbi:MAG: serine hydrolase domain-containing protein [Flavitalea sp.]